MKTVVKLGAVLKIGLVKEKKLFTKLVISSLADSKQLIMNLQAIFLQMLQIQSNSILRILK